MAKLSKDAYIPILNYDRCIGMPTREALATIIGYGLILTLDVSLLVFTINHTAVSTPFITLWLLWYALTMAYVIIFFQSNDYKRLFRFLEQHNSHFYADRIAALFIIFKAAMLPVMIFLLIDNASRNVLNLVYRDLVYDCFKHRIQYNITTDCESLSENCLKVIGWVGEQFANTQFNCSV